MNTYDLAHRFFHDPDARGEYANVNTHFLKYNYGEGHEFWGYYSYSTCVAEIRKNKFGTNILILSDERYSTFTSRHMRQLERANPGYSVVRVPIVDIGYGWWRMDGTYNFLHHLDRVANMTEKDLRKQDNRRYVKHILYMYDEYVRQFSDMDDKSKKLRQSAKVRKVVEMVEQKNARLAEIQARVIPEEVRAANKAKREAALEKKVKGIMSGEDMLSILQSAYNLPTYHRYTENKVRQALREYRNNLQNARDERGRHLSYVWLEGNKAKTSQHCEAPIADVKRLLQLWKAHKDMLGQHAGMYQVVERDDNHVKIGCHVIPAWNIELLCNKLNIA